MDKIPLSHRLRYHFDNTMSKGTPALIGWLFAITAVVIFLVAVFLINSPLVPIEDKKPIGLDKALWNVLMRSIDAGTVAGDVGTWPYLLLMLGVTFFGIFVVSILIGLLTSGIENKLEELRKGRSRVIENNHTVILGWSSQVFTIISELMVANENVKRPAIAILAEKDKVEMEDEIRDRLGSTGNTRVICRSGNPIEMGDLQIVSPQAARSIVILAPEGEDDPDSHVIKTILALTNHPQRKAEPYHIVAEIHAPQNLDVAKMVGGDEVELVLGEDLIARISVQTCRQSGLSVVYTELLDFDGDEIYFQEEPGLVGKTFGEAVMAYEESALMGLRKAQGAILINPPQQEVIETGDKVIAIARDDDAVVLSRIQELQIDEAAIQLQDPEPKQPERTLILGWNQRGYIIMQELDQYVCAGSELTLVADVNDETEAAIQACSEGLVNQKLTFQRADTTHRNVLENLDLAGFAHIITLSYSDTLEMQAADAKTLVTLLHLRDISEKRQTPLSIVSEMLDSRNRELASVTQADDFIVSDKLISLMLSQLSENKELGRVFDDLFQADGSEIYLKPIQDYISLEQPVNFYTLVKAASLRGELAIGYRLQSEAQDSDKGFGVKVNPKKSELVRFGPADKLIVLAED